MTVVGMFFQVVASFFTLIRACVCFEVVPFVGISFLDFALHISLRNSPN